MSTLGTQLTDALAAGRRETAKLEGSAVERSWKQNVAKLAEGQAVNPSHFSRGSYLRLVFENPDPFLREDMLRCNDETKAAFRTTIAYLNKKFASLIEPPSKKDFPWTKHLPR